MNIIIIGLSITSSWGNGHATTYRGLVKELNKRDHRVLFLEQDAPWYASNRDLPAPPYCQTELYRDFEDLRARFATEVRGADFVIVGSYVPDGVAVGEWAVETAKSPVAFYDIDTPVTLANLSRAECSYLSPELVRAYDLYLSFSGGPTLMKLQNEWGSPGARPFYCSVDPALYYPEDVPKDYDLTYLGTYSPDRQPPLEALMLEPARRFREGRFIVVGPQYPADIAWPENVARADHLAPAQHRGFYASGRWTLNITRADMIAAGYSPSVRLFEAAACGVPIVSDAWRGIEEFFVPSEEIVLASTPEESLRALCDISDEERRRIGENARRKVLSHHTAAHRARELEAYAEEVRAGK